MLLPVIERYREVDVPKYFRGDAAFAIPGLYDLLESEGYEYAIRLKANSVLQRRIDHLLKRPVGRPPKKPQRLYHSFEYEAQSWDPPASRGGQSGVAPRRVIPARRVHRDQPRPAGPSVWCTSTTAAAPPSSGSRKASTPCAGRD